MVAVLKLWTQHLRRRLKTFITAQGRSFEKRFWWRSLGTSLFLFLYLSLFFCIENNKTVFSSCLRRHYCARIESSTIHFSVTCHHLDVLYFILKFCNCSETPYTYDRLLQKFSVDHYFWKLVTWKTPAETTWQVILQCKRKHVNY